MILMKIRCKKLQKITVIYNKTVLVFITKQYSNANTRTRSYGTFSTKLVKESGQVNGSINMELNHSDQYSTVQNYYSTRQYSAFSIKAVQGI